MTSDINRREALRRAALLLGGTANNQLHDAPNVFVTDGSCMTSSACQNPSITYMALTARAADYAVREMQRRAL